MNPRVTYALSAVALLLLQITFVPLIGIGGFTPDLLILWVLAFGIRRGRMEATIAGFAVGLLQDITTTQFLGLAALSKSIAGFVAGIFANENTAEQTLGSYRLIFLSFLLSMIHNLVYYFVFYQGIDGSVIAAMLWSTAGTSVYTGIIALLPMFAFARQFRTDWLR